MDEEEFDALRKWRPFGTADAMRLFAESRANTGLVMTLGPALWGTTAEDVQRQLLAPHPEIPSSVDVADLRRLLELTARLSSAVVMLQRMRGMSPALVPQAAVFVGTQAFTLWEARCELVRRAIDYLEGR